MDIRPIGRNGDRINVVYPMIQGMWQAYEMYCKSSNYLYFLYNNTPLK
jgi:hypothetical protein